MFRGHSPSGPGRAQNQAFWVAFPASVFIWFVEALSEYFVKHSWIKGVWQASEDFIIVWLGHCLKREKCFRVQSPRSILVVDETAEDSFPLFLVGGDAVQNGISYLRVQKSWRVLGSECVLFCNVHKGGADPNRRLRAHRAPWLPKCHLWPTWGC